MKITFLISLASICSAFAQVTVDTSFNILSRSGGNSAYYACDLVEFETERIVQKLGGQINDIFCRVGIDSINPFPQPNFVSLTITRPMPASAEVEEITFRGSRGCHLASEIIRGLEDAFPITNIRGAGGCFRPDDSYRIRVEIQR